MAFGLRDWGRSVIRIADPTKPAAGDVSPVIQIVDPRNQLRGTFVLHNSVPEGAFVWIAAGVGHTYWRPTKPAAGDVSAARKVSRRTRLCEFGTHIR